VITKGDTINTKGGAKMGALKGDKISKLHDLNKRLISISSYSSNKLEFTNRDIRWCEVTERRFCKERI